MLATRISFMNEMAGPGRKPSGADIEEVRRALVPIRASATTSSTRAGYGGSCFPSDEGADPHCPRRGARPLLRSVEQVNEAQKHRP